MTTPDPHIIASVEALARIYAAPSERARLKQIHRLDEHCRTLIAASPFLVLATCGPDGADCSPRGEEPGFVHVLDDQTLIFPDRRGNNRLDSLRNIVQCPEVGLLFLIPGVSETLRVNGSATLSVDPDLLRRFEHAGRLPATVVSVRVREAFIQCSKALLRADLWNPDRFVRRSDLPTLGEILAAHTGGRVDAEAFDRQTEQMIRDTLP
jgi:uncharacterized protein